MHTVDATGETFDSYRAAIRAADAIKANVIDTETGRVLWTPAPPASAAAWRRYNERLAAYNAQRSIQ